MCVCRCEYENERVGGCKWKVETEVRESEEEGSKEWGQYTRR